MGSPWLGGSHLIVTLVDEMSVTWTFRGDPGLGLGMALATTMSDKSPGINE